MRIFVTGATGFVGRNFLAYVLQHGLANVPEAEIVCLVRNLEKARSQWADGGGLSPEAQERLSKVQWLQGDLLAPETYADSIRQADWVFHIASLVSLRNGPEFYTQNTDATRCLLSALKAENNLLQRLVMVGSISAIDRDPAVIAAGPLTEETPPHPNTDYGRSKLLAEEAVQASGLPYSILRPAYIYGPYPRAGSSMDRMLRDTLAGKPYTRFPWPGRASAIHAEDLAAMLWTAASHPNTLNETFFACHPEPVLISQAFATLAEVLDVRFSPRQSPLMATMSFLRRQESTSQTEWRRFRERLIRRYPASPMPRILMEDAFLCSADKFIQATGFAPRYDLRAGIRQTIGWLRTNGQL